MSGVTLAVPPTKESTDQAPNSNPSERSRPTADLGGGIMGSLRVVELQLVAFIMVFSASGLVPLIDLVFPAVATAYFLVLSRFVFPSASWKKNESPEIFKGSRFFRWYVVMGTAIGLFLPLAYVLGGFARGDDHAVRSATPHLFLLSFQILTENIISALSLFSPPLRALVPLLYTARRIFVVLDWMKDVWINKSLPGNAELHDVVWHWFGRGLAIANLAYFSINMFCFLIPKFLPKAFEMYFKERDETHAKMSEDKQSSILSKLSDSAKVSDKKSD